MKYFFFPLKTSDLGTSWVYFCQVSKKCQITTLPIKEWMLQCEINMLIRNIHLPNKDSCTCCSPAHWAHKVSQESSEHKSVTSHVLSCSPFFLGKSPLTLLSRLCQWEEIAEVHCCHGFNLFSVLSVKSNISNTVWDKSF